LAEQQEFAEMNGIMMESGLHMGFQDNSIMSANKEFFMSRVLGSVGLIIFWVLMVLLTLSLAYHLKISAFSFALELTFGSIFVIIFLVDPLIYFYLMKLMARKGVKTVLSVYGVGYS
jgi:hypothetical protein